MLKINAFFHFVILSLFLTFSGFSSPSFADSVIGNQPEKYTQLVLIADKSQVRGGDIVRIGLEHIIEPRWHTYWKNPGDSGTPTKIDWNLPPGFSVSELEWPVPIKIPTDVLVNYGYETHAVLLQNLTIPDYVDDTPFILEAKVNLLVCYDICIPESHDVSISFNGASEDSSSAIVKAEKKLPLNKDWEAVFYEQNDNLVFDVLTSDIPDFDLKKDIELLPEDWGAVANKADAELQITDNGFTIKQKRGERVLKKIPELPIVIAYYDSQKQKRGIRLVAKLSESESSAGIAPTATKNNNDGTAAITADLFRALFFAVLGGLILNLMPCVFPVLSMKALSLVGLQTKEENKARGYGISYTAGILVSFGIIGAVLLALKAGGEQIGWGFQLQSPIIVILLTYLVFVIGLNLSGLFEFSGRFANIGQKLTQQSGNRGAFFTGVLATLVATPCTAPFMGVAMGYALTQPAFIAMLVFLALGFGLALPYLALCFIPALRTKLPKPGQWMETFRQFLAFPMFVTVAWLIWVLSQQINSLSIFCILLSLIGIVFITWLTKNIPGKEKPLSRILCEILIIASAIFIVTSTFSAANTKDKITKSHMEIGGQNWQEFTPQRLESLLKTTDAAVFVNMTAAWCITCKVNERIALAIEDTEKIFEEHNIQYLKGDWTNQNPDITAYLNSFDRQGVPIYVFYGPRNGQSGKRPEPVVLPQILTPGLVKKTILENL